MNQKKLTAQEMNASKRVMNVELNNGKKTGRLVASLNVYGRHYVFIMETPNAHFGFTVIGFFDDLQKRNYAALRHFQTEEQLINAMEKA